MKKNNQVQNYIKDESLNIDVIANKIFQDIYDVSHYSNKCVKCNSSLIDLIDNESSIYKCKECKYSFTPRTNSLYQKVRFNNDKWLKILICMISDYTLEETVKIVQSNAETIKKKWEIIYNNIDWNKYNVLVRDKPTKNIYADFEVIIN